MKSTAILLASVLIITCHSIYGQLKLPQLVQDSMVLQRDVPVTIWGWANAGEKVSVRFNKKNYKTTTGADGKWAVTLSSTKAPGPYTMTITASNTITLNNILVGEVWFCSGQSNMEHWMDRHNVEYAQEIATVNNLEIRQFLIPRENNLKGPAEDLPGGSWKTATRANIGRFSVVAYFFAKKLQEIYHVPIGIINASVGGTPIESWTSEEGLKEFPDMLKIIQRNKNTAFVDSVNQAVEAAQKERAKKKEVDKGLTGKIPWYDVEYVPKNWHTINIPGYWEDQGIRDLDGAVWYRKEIDVPASMTGVPAKISLGRIVDADFVYINGKLVGSTSYQYPQRRYDMPADLLKPGKNTFVIRLINYGGKGGFIPDKPYLLATEKDTIDLKGYWQYKVGEVFTRDGNSGGGGISWQNQPTALFNAMAAPATNYTIKGVIWYQGESNAGRAEQYKKLQPAQIVDWRKQWKRPDLPFLFVQLPNFMDATYSPSDGSWALMREAQLQSLSVPNTGMAITIDLGEWNDIHPGRKKVVGDRLALLAQHIAYGNNYIVYSGPIYQSQKIEGNKITLTFDHVGSGLVAVDGEPLNRFAIAGKDKKFVWAEAEIKDDKIVVWSDDVPEPAYVRYAWADNPVDANLYNREGLPASPFRTDP